MLAPWYSLNVIPSVGRDGALRRPRRVQRRNVWRDSRLTRGSFRPLCGRGHRSAMSLPVLPSTVSSSYSAAMEIARRKTLPHEIPSWVDLQKEIYFVTINCEERFRNQLALHEVSARLFETVRHRQEKFLWCPYLFLLMPDHLTRIAFLSAIRK